MRPPPHPRVPTRAVRSTRLSALGYRRPRQSDEVVADPAKKAAAAGVKKKWKAAAARGSSIHPSDGPDHIAAAALGGAVVAGAIGGSLLLDGFGP